MASCDAGIAALASAVSQPSCCLLLLDVSHNFVTPQGMQPLVSAAAAIATSTEAGGEYMTINHLQCQRQQRGRQKKLTVLHECSHEFWRVQAAKQAADQQLAEHDGGQATLGTKPLCREVGTHVYDMSCNSSNSSNSSSWDSCNSCCAGSLQSFDFCSLPTDSNSRVQAKLAAAATGQLQPVQTILSRPAVSPAVWHVMFNTLYQPDDASVVSAVSGPLIPVGVINEDSEICRHYADSPDDVCSSCTEDADSCCSESEHSNSDHHQQQWLCGTHPAVPEVLLDKSDVWLKGVAVSAKAVVSTGKSSAQMAAGEGISDDSCVRNVDPILASSTALSSGGCDAAAVRSGTDQAMIPAAVAAAALALPMPSAAAEAPSSVCVPDLPDAVKPRDITICPTVTSTAAAAACLDSPTKTPLLPPCLPHPSVQPNRSSKRSAGRARTEVAAGVATRDSQQLLLTDWKLPAAVPLAAAKDHPCKASAAGRLAPTAAAGSGACLPGLTAARSQRCRVQAGTAVL
jgi:hypothetical protein